MNAQDSLISELVVRYLYVKIIERKASNTASFSSIHMFYIPEVLLLLLLSYSYQQWQLTQSPSFQQQEHPPRYYSQTQTPTLEDDPTRIHRTWVGLSDHHKVYLTHAHG